ncbi:hypothetical protein B0O79_1126 [Flavobacteriaceae bacterium MAR_2009_75]|nr:hypothetical protein B0O79_1126 [Flavobacteriaceae bacterium MAR_2009_75]
MDLMKKKHVLYEILEKLKIFLRPFYDNGNSLTTEEGIHSKIYEPTYTKSKNFTGK